jgi:ribosome biogenesis protein ENP2
MIHLQNDRSIELHNQSGFYYRTRIPRFGRALGYHYPSCDALVAATGPEVYRLNLDQGRFLNPLLLQGDGNEDVFGVNCIDINSTHQLWAFGCEGNGSVELWDPRSRSKVGILRLPSNRLTPTNLSGIESLPLSVTAISSRSDGLSYVIGTSTGHSLLYDIRSARPYATKDQGYGLPVKKVTWIEGGHKVAGDGMILSADKKVVKVWDRNDVRLVPKIFSTSYTSTDNL